MAVVGGRGGEVEAEAAAETAAAVTAPQQHQQ